MEINNLPALVNKNPNLVSMPHPLSASIDRELFYDEINVGETLGSYMQRLGAVPVIKEDYILTINGTVISFDDINCLYPKNDDLIVIRARVHGGGGDGDKVLRTVLTIAIIVASQGAAAEFLAPYIGGSMSTASAVIVVGGMLLMNALIPIKLPSSADELQPSPTYSLSGSKNRARLFEPLPIVYGVVRMYPDHGAKPYSVINGDNQVLIQVFNFGLSTIEITDMKIGDTDLTSYEDENGNPVTAEISIGDTGTLTSLPDNVDTITGGDLVASVGVPIEKVTSIGTTKIVIDLSGFLFYISDTGSIDTAKLHLNIEYKEISSGTWLPLTGANPVEVKNNNRDLFRRSYELNVAIGQYDVKLTLLNKAFVVVKDIGECFWVPDPINAYVCAEFDWEYEIPFTDDKLSKTLSWDLLKSYQPDDADYSGQKRVGLEIKASGQLNGVIDAFNAMVSSSVLVWIDPDWILSPSSNPAWQYLSLARGEFDGTRRLYGAGLTDDRIDIDTIKLWGGWCNDKGLECNIVFDSKMTVINMLNTIARCGRAVTTWSSGKLGVIYDEANKPAVSVFGMSNIIKDSFSVNYITKNQVDEVVVAFTNPAIGYQRDVVSSLVPGVVSPVNTVTIELKAITSIIQAGKEANLIAAEQFYRRRIIAWESDLEGLAVQRGDVAILAHDLTKWDYSGRLISGNTTVLVLDREIPFTPAIQHYIGIKYPDGTYEIRDVTLDVGNHNTITLLTPLSSSPDADVDNEPRDYIWVFADSSEPGKQIKITDVQPLNQYRVRITATDEEDDYYLSENNTYEYYVPGDFEEEIPTISGLVLREDLVKVGTDFSSKVTANWSISGEYGGAFIRAQEEDLPFYDVGKTLDRQFSFEVRYNQNVTVEVTAFNLEGYIGANSKATATILLIGKRAPPNDVTNFAVEAVETGFLLSWTPVIDADLSEYEIRIGIWDNAVVLATIKADSYLYSNPPVGLNTYSIKAIDTSLNYSVNEKTVTHEVFAPADILDLSASILSGNVLLSWSSEPTSYPIAGYEIREGIVWDGATYITKTAATSYSIDISSSGLKSYLIKAFDIHDNYSVNAGRIDTTVIIPSAPVMTITYDGSNAVLTWNVAVGTFPIDYYEVSNSSVIIAEIKTTSYSVVVTWLSEDFTVIAYDVNGIAGASGGSTSDIIPPSVANLSAEVIDNNVLLRWDDPLDEGIGGFPIRTLPLKAYEVRRGDIFSSADVLQNINGTFAAFFENVSNTYKYWVVGIDTADNYGNEVSVTALVNQPPDYVLNVNWLDNFSGVKTNCVVCPCTGVLVATAHATETFQEHFVNNSWTTPQDQIDDGYLYYIEPSQATGSYVQEFDYTEPLPPTLIKIILDKTIIDGTLVITPTIKVKKLIGDAWTDLGNVWSAFSTDFRYVQTTLTFASTGGDDITNINAMNVVLDSKLKNDGGSGSITNATTGLTVSFNVDFIDVISITVSPNINAMTPENVTAIYDFLDEPNPTSFIVYLYDQATGLKILGDFSWSARGY